MPVTNSTVVRACLGVLAVCFVLAVFDGGIPPIASSSSVSERADGTAAVVMVSAQRQLRVVCVSDLHDTHLESGLLQVPEGDVLIVAGDIELTSERDAAAFRGWLDSQPHRHKVVTFGNMDRWVASTPVEDVRQALGGAHVLIDSTATIEGYKFVGSPQTPKFYGSFQLSTSESGRQHWQRLLPSDTQVDVLITHGPPYGYGDMTQGRHVGDKELLSAVVALQQPPLLWVCGHIHNSYGMYEVPLPSGGHIPLANSAMEYVRSQPSKIKPHMFDLRPRGSM